MLARSLPPNLSSMCRLSMIGADLLNEVLASRAGN
jgi:hypothetical protein